MTHHDVRRPLIAMALLACSAGSVVAQGPPVLSDRPESNGVSTGCLFGSSAIRAATGGVLGGWLGFVAAKIKMSDWNDASRSASANRTRNQMTIGGALIGALGASLVHVNKNCVAATPTLGRQAGRSTITSDEIARAGLSGSVYDVVYSLRRTWLNLRGLNSGSEGVHSVLTTADTLAAVGGEPQLVIYLDNVKLGTVSELMRLSTAGVTSIHYYTPAEANYLWGTGHTHGAIQVVTLEK